jgi:hypothetical protein
MRADKSAPDSTGQGREKVNPWRERAARYRARARASFNVDEKQSLYRLAEHCDRCAALAENQPDRD